MASVLASALAEVAFRSVFTSSTFSSAFLAAASAEIFIHDKRHVTTPPTMAIQVGSVSQKNVSASVTLHPPCQECPPRNPLGVRGRRLLGRAWEHRHFNGEPNTPQPSRPRR